MASTDSNLTSASKLRPYLAIAVHDLRNLWQSRLVRLWVAATVVLTLLLTMGNWTQLSNAPLIASLMFPYLVFPWFLVVIVLGVTPVSGAQAETLADGILCRPVTRYGYLLATWIARVVTVLGSYLIVMIPSIVLITLAKRPTPADEVTLYGIVTSLSLVALVLTLVVSLGFLAGTLLRKPLLATVVLIFVWYPVNFVMSSFSLEEFSPISLSQAITTQLRRPMYPDDTVAKDVTNTQDTAAFTRQASNFLSVLSGTAPIQPQAQKNEFFDPGKFDDFSVFRVTIAYGLPTLASVVLAIFCFYWRDL